MGVAALAGCGGGGDGSPDDYRQAANAVCTRAAAAAMAIPSPSDSAESVAAYSGAVGAIREDETRDLAALDPPNDLEEAHTDLVNASGAIVRSLHDLEQAARRADKQAAAAAAATGARAAVKARAAASELELDACGRPGKAR